MAEFFGTFIFFFIGAGAAITDSYTGGAVGKVGVALANALTVSLLIAGMRHISGAHFNPAVTIGLLIGRQLGRREAVGYILTPLAAGALVGLALQMVFPESAWGPIHLATPDVHRDAAGMAQIGIAQGIAIDALLTFFLMWAIYMTDVEHRSAKIIGFGTGLTVLADTLVGGPFTGASMNPARSFGPALTIGYFPPEQVIYLVGPFIGAVVAALV